MKYQFSLSSLILLFIMLPVLTSCVHQPTCLGFMPDHLKTADYETIINSNVDQKTIVNFFKCRSSMLGDNKAEYQLGLAYEMGQLGLKQNDKTALRWYNEASKPYNGTIYIHANNASVSRGVPMPGYAEAQYRLGLMYLEGRGTKKRENFAKMWFRNAAEQGHEPAKVKLNDMGNGGEVDG
ncbi:MAG: tetratricopeptide repeat protein [Emcibacteraceae bacterium]|nr:tetratricopeptide repeat protein [Emcibacteraceae bacterium]